AFATYRGVSVLARSRICACITAVRIPLRTILAAIFGLLRPKVGERGARRCRPVRGSGARVLVGDSEHARRIVGPVAGKVLSCPKKWIIRPAPARRFLYCEKDVQQIGVY